MQAANFYVYAVLCGCVQVLYRTVSIHEQSGEGDELGPCLLEEVVPYRQFTAQEVELLGMLNGLEVRQPAWDFFCLLSNCQW